MNLDARSSFNDYLKELNSDITPIKNNSENLTPQATTIVAVVFNQGVLMAGDRRATMGHIVAQKDIEKVFPADSESIIGIAGSAGIALELVKLFQVELEHYEKIEGTVGLGYRVPMIIASPWTKGGFVNSEVSDHTSVLQFLEKFIMKKFNKNVHVENISDWRRAICGDLTSAFNSSSRAPISVCWAASPASPRAKAK